jgi:FtsH-binding integral membrane protein
MQMDHSHSSNESYQNLKDWSESDRLGFIKKVYGILAAQLLLTSSMCLLPVLNTSSRLFMQQNFGLAIFFAIAGLIMTCVLFCGRKVAR